MYCTNVYIFSTSYSLNMTRVVCFTIQTFRTNLPLLSEVFIQFSLPPNYPMFWCYPTSIMACGAKLETLLKELNGTHIVHFNCVEGKNVVPHLSDFSVPKSFRHFGTVCQLRCAKIDTKLTILLLFKKNPAAISINSPLIRYFSLFKKGDRS